MGITDLAYGVNLASAGALEGLNKGLKERDQRQRYDLADRRAQESHDMTMQTGQVTLDEHKLKLDHERFTTAVDPALGSFIVSDGLNYEPLRDVVKTTFPGGEGFDMTRDEKSGKFSLKFTDGREVKDLDPQHVAGLVMHAQDPESYRKAAIAAEAYQMKATAEQAAKAAEFNRQQPIKEKAQRVKDDAALERTKISANARTTAAATPRSILTPADDGTYALVGASGAKPIPGTGPAGRDPTAALTFTKPKGGGKSGANTSKDMNDIDAMAADTNRLPVVEGETPPQRWLRAAAEHASKITGKNDPEAAVRKFESSLSAKVFSNPALQDDPDAQRKAQEFVDDAVTKFKDRYSAGGAQGDNPMGVDPKLMQ